MYRMLKRLNSVIYRVESGLLVLLMGLITVIMTAQVLMRFIFQSPLTWSQELTLFLLIYLCYIGADVVFYRNEHICVEYFVDRLPAVYQRWAAVLVNVIICAALLVILPYSFIIIEKQMDHVIAGVLPISKSFWVLPLAIGFVSMVLKSVEKIIAASRGEVLP